MTDLSNRQFLLAKRPSGDVRREDFTYQEAPVTALAEGQILVRNKYLSLDPAMRGWMNDGKSYIPAVKLGEVMRALGVGEVLESKNPKFAVGDHLQGALGVQDYFVGEPKGFYKVDTSLAPLPLYLSALGMTGMTA
ncbi:Quinone oxidoreductase [Pseudomonas amygdali pv. lachrymans]|nr:Quinone oxidoreductase [Pseudomonas amygdali pv. lachrymans]KPC14399.1 Quinone oxidoreductase [Pseudomonas amygdali pv. lachrymans]RMM46025.1 Quinone oxidoreductase [Pseudomonas amygdali pv. lachrymans]RMP44987.1 Quinone oxidoreductase [Pseudomonas amygdali pv. lachrymans]RMT15400.1 Quinone oxidoreductase [Pseudomonas amygdali pv. lachrymans]